MIGFWQEVERGMSDTLAAGRTDPYLSTPVARAN